MRILILCLFLISCGGGGSVPESPGNFEAINLEGRWELSITIPECKNKFVSIYYAAIDGDAHQKLKSLTSFGAYPDMQNMAACNEKMIPNVVGLDPYTTVSTADQFKEFLSLRFLWVYDSIDIVEYSTSHIRLLRTVQTLVGERVWSYHFKRIESIYSSSQKYQLNSLAGGTIAVKDCQPTYATTFKFQEGVDIFRFAEYLHMTDESPLLTVADPCGLSNKATSLLLPTFFPMDITALEFRNLMQGIWGWETTILSWYPDTISMVRVENGFTVGYSFKNNTN